MSLKGKLFCEICTKNIKKRTINYVVLFFAVFIFAFVSMFFITSFRRFYSTSYDNIYSLKSENVYSLQSFVEANIDNFYDERISYSIVAPIKLEDKAVFVRFEQYDDKFEDDGVVALDHYRTEGTLRIGDKVNFLGNKRTVVGFGYSWVCRIVDLPKDIEGDYFLDVEMKNPFSVEQLASLDNLGIKIIKDTHATPDYGYGFLVALIIALITFFTAVVLWRLLSDLFEDFASVSVIGTTPAEISLFSFLPVAIIYIFGFTTGVVAEYFTANAYEMSYLVDFGDILQPTDYIFAIVSLTVVFISTYFAVCAIKAKRRGSKLCLS